MGEDDAKLIRVGAELAGLLVEHGLQPTSSVLDVGCGTVVWPGQAGLEMAALERGTWAGEPGRVFQDLVVMRHPASRRNRAVDAVRQAGRAANRTSP